MVASCSATNGIVARRNPRRPRYTTNAPSPEERAERKRRKAAISRRIRKEVLVEFSIDKLPKESERTLIAGAQGTGKSRTVAEGIAALRHELALWWLVPTLEKAEEQRAEYDRIADPVSPPSMVIRGRGAADPRVPGQTMCPRHQVVNRAAAMGVEVQKEICRSCPRISTCGFQAQRQRVNEQPTGLFFMSSEYLYLPCPAPRPDLVVVDESIIDRAAEIVSFDPTRITEDDKWVVHRDLAASLELRRIASTVRHAITSHAGCELEFLRNEGVTQDDLRICIRHLAQSEEATQNVNGRMTDEQIAAALDAIEAREIMKVLKLFRQIRREIDQPRRRLNSVWFDPAARVTVGGETERQPRVFVGYVRQPQLARTTPVLALDGTGSLELNRKVFGTAMEGHRFAVPRDAKAIQTVDKLFSRQSLTGTDRHGNPVHGRSLAEAARLRGRVVELLRVLPDQVLLVTYKQVQELIRGDLPEHVSVAHFGNVRGLNAFENYGTVVILGRQQPSAQAIENLTRPFTAVDPEPFLPFGEYAPQARGRRQRQDGPNVAVVPVHPDMRCQELLEQVREAEIVQAVDRVRPVFNRRRIILLTEVPVDITVDRVVSWRQLRPNSLLVAFARYGVLPLAPSDMARAFPDIFKTVNSAKQALSRTGFKGYISQIESLFGVCTSLIPGVALATYRRSSQRGWPARAVLCAGLPDPRSALEALVGQLAQFAIDVIEMPDESARDGASSQSQDVPREPASSSPSEARPSWSTSIRALRPLAAALAAEAHLLGSSDPSERPPDVLGFPRVLLLMRLRTEEERRRAA